ncbi:hypothetical protein EV281_11533 [Rhizobium sp. BK418]|nr:hypothetical protein EV281_11533 [Rhizobium sp. BK418]
MVSAQKLRSVDQFGCRVLKNVNGAQGCLSDNGSIRQKCRNLRRGRGVARDRINPRWITQLIYQLFYVGDHVRGNSGVPRMFPSICCHIANFVFLDCGRCGMSQWSMYPGCEWMPSWLIPPMEFASAYHAVMCKGCSQTTDSVSGLWT